MLGLGLAAAAVIPACSSPAPKRAWKTVFLDDFTGRKGALPDPAKWRTETGNGAVVGGNGESEVYTGAPENVSLDGKGNLVISVTNDGYGGFHSGRITTQGRFSSDWPCIWEARIRITPAKGCWPAFWFLGNKGHWPACGEVDVMENYGKANNGLSQATVHSGGADGQPAYLANFVADTAFHVYRMVWEKDTISVYQDGRRILAARAADLSPWPFNTNGGMYCLLNVATNGTGTDGVQPSKSSMPVRMLVDYVRCMVPA
jgi:beta-glucanase (GH16 family)